VTRANSDVRTALLRSVGRIHGAVVSQRRILRLADHVAALMPHGASVLDIGCGDGKLASQIREQRPDLRICGIDVLIRPPVPLPVAQFDGFRVPVRDRGVDVALMVDVLHHTEDPLILLKEASRVARQAVVIKDHVADRRAAHILLRIMDWVGNAPHGVALPYNYLSRRQWTEAFREAGLHPQVWRGRLDLYPRPFSLLLDRDMHFVACLRAA